MDKAIRKYTRLYSAALRKKRISDTDGKAAAYADRLETMYASDAFKKHNIYPTMDVPLVYAVIAMCLELRGFGFSDWEIMEFSDCVFRSRRKFFAGLMKLVNLLPCSYRIAEKWNIGDHEKRIKDGSITYDTFAVADGKIEYCISRCMYHVCRNVRFIRHPQPVQDLLHYG